MSQRQSEDRVQIHYTMALYCNSVDSGDVDGVLSAFTDDAQLELSSGTKVRGKAAIHAFYLPVIGPDRPDRAAGEPIPLLRHNLTTSRVEFTDDDTAQGWTYFMSLTRHGLDHTGRYVDRLVRRGERWLLDDRRILVEWYASPSWYEQVRLKAGSAKR
jgi:hypothetical protein